MSRQKRPKPRTNEPRRGTKSTAKPHAVGRSKREKTKPGVLERMRAPRPIARLEFLRVFLPLAILGFMSSRMMHADHWLGMSGFEIPDLGGDYRQPLFLPRLPNPIAYLFVGVMGISGILLSLGVRARLSAAIFSATLFFALYSDRLSAFTVSKIAPVLVFALAVSPAGARYGIDAMLRLRKARGEDERSKRTHRDDSVLPEQVRYGNIFFFQAFIVSMYSASGICKARGDWLDTPYLLHTHLHGSYQTIVSWWAANHLPAFSWNIFQGTTLFFELFAPLLFYFEKLRPYALIYGLSMHAIIGLMFGPVVWFALLMSIVLIACFAPASWLDAALSRLFPSPRSADPSSARSESFETKE